ADLMAFGKRDGSPLGPETTGKVHRLLHRALRDAVRWDRLSRNPASVAESPRAPRPKMVTWNTSQLAIFLEQARGDGFYALWQLIATSGLRRSEALGLRWGDVDLDQARLSVSQTLAYVGTRAVLDAPKTDPKPPSRHPRA